MRTGIVISYNKEEKQGLIKDNNGQNIKFYIEGNAETFEHLDVVKFNIAFISNSLRAVNVMHVLDRQGKPVTITT